jgi:hypothetical protein
MISLGMANPEYIWWIAERLPPAASGGVQAHRLTQYGSFPDKESAERKISELNGLASWWKYVQELLADIFQTYGSEPAESDSKPRRIRSADEVNF